MIRTDGRPTIAWAPRVTSEPAPEPPQESADQKAIRMAIIRLGLSPRRAHLLAHAITHPQESR
jgi:hypothetical protein